MLRTITFGCVLAFAGLLASRAAANPSTILPDAPFQIRAGDDVSRRLLDGLVPLDRRSATLLEALEGKLAEGELSAQNAQEVGEVAVANYLQRTYGKMLGERSEASGYDFERRASDYSQRLKRIVERLRKLPGFRADLTNQQFEQLQATGLRRLAGWQQQAKAGGLEPVEQELLRFLAELERYAVWLENPKYAPELGQLLDEIRPPLEKARLEQLAGELTAQQTAQGPKYDELLERIAAAIAEVQRGGVAPWNGQTVSGPQLLAAIVADWQVAHQRALRSRALQLASRGPATSVAGAEEIERADSEIAGQVRSALAKLIEADAQRVKPADVPGLHLDYLRAAGGQPQIGDRAAYLAALQPALDKLAAKDQALAAETRAIESATSELLRWRRRVAAAQALRLQRTGYPQAAELYTSAVRSRLNDPALLAHDAPADFSALLGPAPKVLRRLRAGVVGRPCTVMDVVGLGGGKASSRYSARTYARLTVPLAPEYDQEMAALKRSLLATGDDPPLSLDAALALAGARQDCFERVGGVIQEVGLEPLLTRFATISDQTTGLSPPDKMPGEPLQEDLRPHVLARLFLTPHWVQHECFVAVVYSPPAVERD